MSIDINLYPFSHIIFAPDLITKQNKIMITTIFLILIPLLVGFVNGQSFQLAAPTVPSIGEEASLPPQPSNVSKIPYPVSLPGRDSSRSRCPQKHCSPSPCGEVRRGFLLLYSQLSCRKPPTTRPAKLYIECPNQRPINHRRPVPRRRSNRGRKPLTGHDQSGSIAILRSLSLPWSAP